MTPHEWALEIRALMETSFTDYDDDPVTIIGGPNVAGDIPECGLIVLIEAGEGEAIWQTQEFWPIQLADDERPGLARNHAAAITVRVLRCRPQRDSSGRSPNMATLDDAAEDLWGIGWRLFTVLIDSAANWAKMQGHGRVAVGPVTAVPKEGRFSGWECRLTVPVC